MSMRIKRQRRPSFITPKWRFCPKCGVRNDYHAKFCRVCATSLDVKGTFDETTDGTA